ncbi:MAG: chromosomal replication initiator protein DnaA [Anaerolineales bacterium]
MNIEQAWKSVLGQLQMDMPRASFETWVRDTYPLSYQNGVLTVGTPNAYARDWLEARLTSTVNRMLIGILNAYVQVRFVVAPPPGAETEALPAEEITAREEEKTPRPSHPRLNARYTFETFVVGSGNRLAHAASIAVAERPARAYNPLFLYGGVGLGKTHLLHAIGNFCHARGLKVLYVSSEEFTNDLINAIRNQTTQAFREKYRSIDILLVDDIQFIAGKESTQEEFFHTFNALHSQEKQIIISSDRSPKALVTLEERLRSRFEWGLIADIQPPDFETRLAILRHKAERLGRSVPMEILELIARRIQSNIRELEGALNRVLAFADLSGIPLTTDLVDVALADILPSRNGVDSRRIIEAVAQTFNISAEKLLSRDRSREVALPRQVAMYLLREEANASLPQIGEALGGRDHTTVMYAIEKVREMIERDDLLRRQVIQIRQQIYGQSAVV